MWIHALSLLEIPKRRRHDSPEHGPEPPPVQISLRERQTVASAARNTANAAAGYSGEGEHRSRWQAEQRPGAKGEQ
jgi:hypothetical protein